MDQRTGELVVVTGMTGAGRSTAAKELEDLGYYVVFALWKMAVLLEGHWARHVRGTAGAFDFAYLETAGPAFWARLHRTADEA